jgi:alpha-glucosidase
MADPSDLSLRREEPAFLLGADLLVVPSWAKKPNLPRGIWSELSLVACDREDPDQAKILIRAGPIMPLGRVVQSTEEGSLAPLTLQVCLDKDGRVTGQLYEDDGEGFGYRQGHFLALTYHAERRGDKVRVGVSNLVGRRPLRKRDAVIEVVEENGQRQNSITTGL